MTIILVITLILFFSFYISLNNRISSLEKIIEEMKKNDAPRTTKTAREIFSGSQAANTNTSAPIEPAMTSSSSEVKSHVPATDTITDWFRTDTLLKVGAILFVLGIAWFVSYAFTQNWIGPEGRIALGVIVGLIFTGLGELRARSEQHQGTTIMAVGATTVLLTIFSARLFYDFFNPLTATISMVAILVLVTISALMHKQQARAWVALLGAAIVPFLTNSDSSSAAGLFTYLLVITSGIIWVVNLTGWRALSAATAVIYAFYSLLTIGGFDDAESALLRVLIAVLSAILIVATAVSQARDSGKPARQGLDILTTGITTLFGIVWIDRLVGDELQPVIAASLGSALLLLGYGLHMMHSRKMVVLQYVMLGFVLLTAAANFGLDGPLLHMTYFGLIAAAAISGHAVTAKIATPLAILALTIPLNVRHIFELLRTHAPIDAFYEGAFLATIGAILLGGVTYLFYLRRTNEDEEQLKSLVTVYMVAAYFQLLIIFWQMAKIAWFTEEVGHAVSLIVFTILGIAGYLWGASRQHQRAYLTSLAVLGFVIVRLLTVEVWNMDIIGRVIVFILIGLLLMSTTFFKPKKNRAQHAEHTTTPPRPH